MQYEFIKMSMKNSRPGCAHLQGYREIIEDFASKGYKFLNWLPVKQGASGKILEIELVFGKE